MQHEAMVTITQITEAARQLKSPVPHERMAAYGKLISMLADWGRRNKMPQEARILAKLGDRIQMDAHMTATAPDSSGMGHDDTRSMYASGAPGGDVLRNGLIRLAHAQPELRPILLPLLTER